MDNIWGAVGALSAAVGTLVVLATVIYAAGQVREARLARTVDTLLAIYQQAQSAEQNRVRSRLLRRELGDLSRLEEGQDKQALGNLLNQLELLSILVERKLLDFDLVATVFSHIPRTWEIAQPYIISQRERNSSYAVHVERLAKRFDEHTGRGKRLVVGP